MNKKGFTIIELLIVTAIIGSLASVVLSGLGGIKKSARDARRIADLHQMQIGLEEYYSKNGFYPQIANMTPLALGLVSLPVDPSSTPANPIHYYYSVNNASFAMSYTLGAVLESSSNPLLSKDIDLNVNLAAGDFPANNSHNCSDPVYCISVQ